ncbi:9808_t:CDS:2 [Funneliformis geosporum]|uniref:8034_t:CDS:1 n=1 Tax=Funneliformis geosporum TaxID=1117311 RepID=A0A9W4X455_9GLOM|nr:9808_t:CDS:2 [Funneliformis geosporum]CAI2185180.1 8034_t:CDS:2 [Funneliformis geosporum]
MPIAFRLRSSKKKFDINNIQFDTTPEKQLSTPSVKPSKSKAKKNVNSSKNSKLKSSVAKGSNIIESKDDIEHSSAADQDNQIPENSKITQGIDEIVTLGKDSSIETLTSNDIDKSNSIESISQNQSINNIAEESQPINATEDKKEAATLEKNENELRELVDNIAENIQVNLETSEALVDSGLHDILVKDKLEESVPSETSNVIEQTTSPTDSDDEAPETISMSTSKILALSIKKKERQVQQKSLEIKKRKRREIDAKLKEQKIRKTVKLVKSTDTEESKEEIDNIIKKINEEGLPRFLPTELLKDFANDDKVKKKRKQPEEHMQVKSKIRKTELQSKKENSRKQTGPFSVIALQDSNFDKPTPIAKGVAEFKEDHFYGKRLPRKNAILNASQGRRGAAIRFCRT